MLKKFLFGAICAAVMGIGASSCSNEEDVAPVNGLDGPKVITTISVKKQAPGLRARSVAAKEIGTGAKASNLRYAVYNPDGSILYKWLGEGNSESTGAAPVANASGWDLSLKLAQGVSYKVFFWADAGKSFQSIANTTSEQYALDFGAKTVTVAYPSDDNVVTDFDDNDAFCYNGSIVAGTTSSITMTRPLTLVCLGTSDYDNAVVKSAYPNGVFCAFGTASATVINMIQGVSSGNIGGLPHVWNWETNKVVSLYPQSSVYTSCSENLQEYLFPIAGYKFIYAAFVLAGDMSDFSNYHWAFSLSQNENGNPRSRFYSGELTSLNSVDANIPFIPNHRLIFTDGNGDDGSGTGGGSGSGSGGDGLLMGDYSLTISNNSAFSGNSSSNF